VVVVNLNLDYLKPVPLNQEIEIIGHVAEVEKEGKIVKANGEIRLPDGNVAVKASGTYVNAPQFFGKLIEKFFHD
jgi:acyl-coenzyme A thioesterase PaaI-like protein